MTSIDVVSGFLGAGKTTLIKKLLAEKKAEEKLAVIENEFGEVGIDGAVLRSSGVQIREISAGCICCSLSGNFELALRDVLRRYRPDRVIVEPSGVGRLSDILAACRRVAEREGARPGLAVTVADVLKYRLYARNFGEFYSDQLRYADLIVLSRTQLADGARLTETVDDIRRQNARAGVVTTPWDRLTAASILGAASAAGALESSLAGPADAEGAHGHEECHHDAHEHGECHHHDAHDSFESWGLETPAFFTQPRLSDILQALDGPGYGEILRAKGYLPARGGSFLSFDYVPGERRIGACAPEAIGRVCVIGRGLSRDGLAALFRPQEDGR